MPRQPEHTLRSWLFVPGADERKLAKVEAVTADAIIYDLEDSVAEARKGEARGLVGRELARHGAERALYVRVNAAETGHLADDLGAICCPQLAGIWLPKAESVEDIGKADELLSGLESARGMAPGTVHLLLSLETARGVHFTYELASATPRVTAVSAGTAEGGDLHADMGGAWGDDGATLAYVRARIAVAARAAGLAAIVDGACSRLDEESVSRSAMAARDAGYSGKMAIHPGHVAAIHAAFAPGDEEIAHAREVVRAFAEAEAAGTAAISVGGRMIDYAMVVHARQVLGAARPDNPAGDNS